MDMETMHGNDYGDYQELLPLPMILHCPQCGLQHIDKPDPAIGWNNPPHKSHLCLGCGIVWRPADVPTTGVESIQTRGKADTWPSVDSLDLPTQHEEYLR